VTSDELFLSSAIRLSFCFVTNAPAVMIDRECRSLVRKIAGRVGPAQVRRWLDEYLDDAVERVSTGPDAD
jgi:hypothetical protein